MNPLTLALLLSGSLAASRPGLEPAPPDSTVADAAAASLRADLQSLLRRYRLGPDAGVLVVSLDRGDTLFAHNPDLALAPASNLKLYTSLAALFYLGPTFRYNTYLLASGPVVDGVLRGDVILYGTGDPTLSDRFGADVLAAFADTLAALGIHEIQGDVVGDASYFGGPGIGTGWRSAYSNATYAAPASALSLSENLASVVIRPSPTAGGSADVHIAPGGDGIEIINQATTVAGRTRLTLGRGDYDAPLTVRGTVSTQSRGVTYTVPVSDPPRFAAAALREAIESRGLRIAGVTRSVIDPRGSSLDSRSPFAPAFGRAGTRVLAIHTSPPLLDILEVVNKKSNNFMAEQVVRTVGRVARGDGTVQGGTAAVREFAVNRLGVDPSVIELFDGSGLSPLNRVSAGMTVQLLEYARQGPLWPSFWRTLPESGAPGELKRMLRTPAEGHVRAKTGTIRNVSALSGYVTTQVGERLAFSVINNRASNAWRAKQAEDEIVVRLAVYDRPPSAETPAVPQPASVTGSDPGN